MNTRLILFAFLASAFDWSPDGKRIVTAISHSERDRAIAVYDRIRHRLRRFADAFHRVLHPTWSPDGRFIAFAAKTEQGARADINLARASD